MRTDTGGPLRAIHAPVAMDTEYVYPHVYPVCKGLRRSVSSSPARARHTRATSEPAPSSYGAPPAAGYASWLARVGAVLIDGLADPVAAAFYAGYISLLGSHSPPRGTPTAASAVHVTGSIGLPVTLMVVGTITSLAFFVWNNCIRQGRTGATVGKSVLAIRLVNADRQPIGAGLAFLRYLLHIVNALPATSATSGRSGTPSSRPSPTRS